MVRDKKIARYLIIFSGYSKHTLRKFFPIPEQILFSIVLTLHTNTQNKFHTKHWSRRSTENYRIRAIVSSCKYIPNDITDIFFPIQTHFYKWIRDHRTHHRYTETCADPHDATRGFFFSHIGWLMVKRDPAVKEYGSKIDMSDIAADPVIKFFDK